MAKVELRACCRIECGLGGSGPGRSGPIERTASRSSRGRFPTVPRASSAPFGTAGGLPAQRAEVVDRGVELPLAAAALRPPHAEPAGPLAVPHLTEDGLDGAPPLAVKAAAPLRPQLAVHALPRRQAFRHAPARRWGITQGGALLAVLARRDEQLAFLGLAGGVGL